MFTETPHTVTIRREDVVTISIKYKPVTIDIFNYPELNGLSESQIQDYIKNNAYSMRGLTLDSLGEDIEYAVVESQKTEDEFVDWIFESKYELD